MGTVTALRPKIGAGLICAALFGLAAPAIANAAVYSYKPEILTSAGASAAVQDKNTTASTATFTDDFIFTLMSPYSTALGATLFEHKPQSYDVITAADLTLFSGSPGTGTLIETTGTQPFSGTGTDATSFLINNLPAGNYYLEATITVPRGDTGDYSVNAFASPSAVPEPSAWALMIAGVGMVGGMLRSMKARGAALLA